MSRSRVESGWQLGVCVQTENKLDRCFLDLFGFPRLRPSGCMSLTTGECCLCVQTTLWSLVNLLTLSWTSATGRG